MANRLLITGGAVLSVDSSIGELRKGDVLIEDDTIVEVGPSVDASDCETIDATGMIVMPGLVDSHRHFWQTGTRSDSVDSVFWDLVASQWPKIAAHYRAEDVYAAVIAGAADAIDAGVTTVLDWCHVVNTPEHAEENLRALREIGIRSLFLYGASMSRKLQEYEGHTEHEDSWAPARRMRESEFSSDGGLITFGLAIQGPDVTTMEITADDLAAARQLGVPVGIHIGAPEGGEPHYSMKRMHEAGLLGPDINFSHCCNNTDEELRLVADSGGQLVACPSREHASAMTWSRTALIQYSACHALARAMHMRACRTWCQARPARSSRRGRVVGGTSTVSPNTVRQLGPRGPKSAARARCGSTTRSAR